MRLLDTAFSFLEVKIMNDKKLYGDKQCEKPCGHKRGSSSYRMQEPGLVFDNLELTVGDCFLDIGCGPGDYTIRASEIVGNSGVVYALDVSQAMIDEVRKKTARKGVKNVRAIACDVTRLLPIENDFVDVCLMATVLHIPVVTGNVRALFAEVRRVLKPGGHFVIIECKKDNMCFGPPQEMRLSPKEIEAFTKPHGFKKTALIDLGYNYLINFVAKQARKGWRPVP